MEKEMKSVLVLILGVILLNVLFAGLVVAQTGEEIYVGDVLESPIDEPEFDAEAGTTPDSALYFLDEFFDRFGDELKIREEKIAEIKEMIEKGNFEAARKALKSYKEKAEELEREVDPSRRDDALRSATAIRNLLGDLQGNIPEGEKDEFVREVIERERLIATSVEIASKIKELCETLSEIDPLEYSRVCKTDSDSPRWQRDLDEDLTQEQKEEAEELIGIMSECFETSGGTCRCDDISFTEFANQCSIIAPLAFACDVEQDESACDELDRIEDKQDLFDLLPEYLQDALRHLEDDFMESQFDNHIPGLCREAGIDGTERSDREECFRIMVNENAPEECREALIEANVDNERDAREICESIMFELNAPRECVERGLTSPRECGRLMFELNAPQECLDAGLTGEHRSDREDCERIAGEFREDSGEGNFSFGANCREIEDAEERLTCYDKAASGARDFREDEFDFRENCLSEEEFKDKVNECRSECPDCRWKPEYDNSGTGSHFCAVGVRCELDEGNFEDHEEDDFDEEDFSDDFEDHEEEFRNGFDESTETDLERESSGTESFEDDSSGSDSSGTGSEGSGEPSTSPSGEGGETSDSGSESSDSGDGGGDDSSSDEESTGTGAAITGFSVFNDNGFLDYLFG